jgi:hypothetical protein
VLGRWAGRAPCPGLGPLPSTPSARLATRATRGGITLVSHGMPSGPRQDPLKQSLKEHADTSTAKGAGTWAHQNHDSRHPGLGEGLTSPPTALNGSRPTPRLAASSPMRNHPTPPPPGPPHKKTRSSSATHVTGRACRAGCMMQAARALRLLWLGPRSTAASCRWGSRPRPGFAPRRRGGGPRRGGFRRPSLGPVRPPSLP